MLHGGPQWYMMEGDPGRRRRRRGGFFHRAFKVPRGIRRAVSLRNLRGVAGAFSDFIPGGEALSSLGLIGDPGLGHLKRALKKHGSRAASHGRKHSRFSFGAALNAAASFASSHPGITSFGQSLLGGVPVVGGGLENLAQQALGGGGGGPSLEDASDVTGLPTDHPHTKAVHKAMGGRHRRMNFANPKALRRSVSRLTSFVRHYKKAASHLGYHLHRGAARAMHKRRK